MLESWEQRRFFGAYSHYAAGEVQTFRVTVSINAADPYFWLQGQATNSSAVFCAPLVLSAIANGSGPGGTKVEIVRLTWMLKWEHVKAAKARGGALAVHTTHRQRERRLAHLGQARLGRARGLHAHAHACTRTHARARAR
jgi:hypothetical protein